MATTAAAQTQPRELQERMARTVLGFLRARARLDELIALGASAGGIPFAEVDHFVEEDLFKLKEACHLLFRGKENAEEENISSGELFDILFGTAFHQMMMVKENTYQIEIYGPKYEALRRAVRGPDPPKEGNAFLREGEQLLKRARNALREDLQEVVSLFSKAADALRRTLPQDRDNPLLVRMLLDNREAVEAVYGPRSLQKILYEMYDGRAAIAYLVAAGDMLEGGWYDRARELCQQARSLEPENERAAALLNKINAAARSHLN